METLFNIIKRNGKVMFSRFYKEFNSDPQKGWIKYFNELGHWYVLYKGKVYYCSDFENKVKNGVIKL